VIRDNIKSHVFESNSAPTAHVIYCPTLTPHPTPQTQLNDHITYTNYLPSSTWTTFTIILTPILSEHTESKHPQLCLHAHDDLPPYMTLPYFQHPKSIMWGPFPCITQALILTQNPCFIDNPCLLEPSTHRIALSTRHKTFSTTTITYIGKQTYAYEYLANDESLNTMNVEWFISHLVLIYTHIHAHTHIHARTDTRTHRHTHTHMHTFDSISRGLPYPRYTLYKKKKVIVNENNKFLCFELSEKCNWKQKSKEFFEFNYKSQITRA